VAATLRGILPNRQREAERGPTWRALLRPFQDQLVVVLLVAAAVSAVVPRPWETPVVILVVVVFNAMINFVQERDAEASLQPLQHMTVAQGDCAPG
jgi:P-type Ca2+ transporter type 2C